MLACAPLPERSIVWACQRRLPNGLSTYPYYLRDLLLAVEVASPGNPRLDYQVKRDLYLREGVGEYGSSVPRRETSRAAVDGPTLAMC